MQKIRIYRFKFLKKYYAENQYIKNLKNGKSGRYRLPVCLPLSYRLYLYRCLIFEQRFFCRW